MPTSLLSSVSYGSYLIYSPRGNSDTAAYSRRIRDAVKYGREDVLRNIALRLSQVISETDLNNMLGEDITLVPAPRSAPLVQGALWPSNVICAELVRVGLGREIQPILTRVTAVGKAAFAAPGQRPTLMDHYNAMEVVPALISGTRITIVDDIITKGSTLLASASRVQEAYSDHEISVFALVRTMGLIPDIEKIEDPVTGIIPALLGHGDRQP